MVYNLFGLILLLFTIGVSNADTVTPLQVYPSGTILKGNTCSQYDTQVVNSCAYKNRTATAMNTNFNTFVSQVIGAIGATGAGKEGVLNTYFTTFSNLMCNGKRIKACVKKDKLMSRVLIYSQSLKLSEFRSKVSDSVKNGIITTTQIATSRAGLNQTISTHNNNFAVIASGSPMPTLLEYFPPATLTDSQILDNLKVKTSSTASLQVGFHIYDSHVPTPNPDYVSSRKVNFMDNQATFSDSSGNDLVQDVKTWLGNKIPTKIRIYSSSSTLNNTANYCAKDFKNLTKDRAFMIKSMLESALSISIPVGNLDVGGRNSDGSSGECAYQCQSSSGNCIETPNVALQAKASSLGKTISQYLDQYQEVKVSVWIPPAVTTGTSGTDTMAVSVVVPENKVYVSCLEDAAPRCIKSSSVPGLVNEYDSP